MKRANSIVCPTNGSSALKISHNGFTVIEGGLSISHDARSSVPAAQQLSFAQKAKAFLAIFAVIVSLGCALVISNSLSEARFARTFERVPQTSIIVHTGDSLWDIALRHAPEGVDTPDVVRWIVQENALESSCIYAGQVLVVPNV